MSEGRTLVFGAGGGLLEKIVHHPLLAEDRHLLDYVALVRGSRYLFARVFLWGDVEGCEKRRGAALCI